MTALPDEREIWVRGVALFLTAAGVWYLLGAFVRPARESVLGLPLAVESAVAGVILALGATAVRLFAIRRLDRDSEE